MDIQQGDVVLFQTGDGGNIKSINGLITMSGGLQTATYLSLFGGNQYDIENQGVETLTFKEWWGNIGEVEENQYKSETQNIIDGMPPSSANLKRLEESAKTDLNWMIDTNLASEINIDASIPQLNVVKLVIRINQQEFEFIENWRNQ